MGTMEKAGVAVVGVVICIIVAVGLLNKRDDKTADAGRGDTKANAKKANPRSGQGLRRSSTRRPGTAKTNQKKPVKRGARDEPRQGPRPRPRPRTGERPILPIGKEPIEIVKADRPTSSIPKPKPVGDWPKRHKIVKGDILERIVVKTYGNRRMLPTVMKANAELDPRRMRIGRTVVLPAPDPAVLSKASKTTSTTSVALSRPSFIPTSYVQSNESSRKVRPVAAGSKARTYEVKKGDTLGIISQKLYGTARHADQIFKANRGLMKSKNKLQIGWILDLPTVD